MTEDFFKEYTFVNKSNYEYYRSSAEKMVQENRRNIKSEIAKNSHELGLAKNQYESDKLFLRDNPELAKHYPLEERKNTVEELEAYRKNLSA